MFTVLFLFLQFIFDTPFSLLTYFVYPLGVDVGSSVDRANLIGFYYQQYYSLIPHLVFLGFFGWILGSSIKKRWKIIIIGGIMLILSLGAIFLIGIGLGVGGIG